MSRWDGSLQERVPGLRGHILMRSLLWGGERSWGFTLKTEQRYVWVCGCRLAKQGLLSVESCVWSHADIMSQMFKDWMFSHWAGAFLQSCLQGFWDIKEQVGVRRIGRTVLLRVRRTIRLNHKRQSQQTKSKGLTLRPPLKLLPSIWSQLEKENRDQIMISNSEGVFVFIRNPL